MTDNIFDAQRNRRIQNLQQQSVSNIVKTNPNLRGVLTRYEDAEVSRLKLLELQRLRSKKITAGEKALLKAVSKRSGRRRGRQKQQKETKPAEPPIKPQTQIEVEAEEKRRRLAQQDRFLQLEDFKQQREFLTAAQDRQQRELVRQQQFITDMALLGQRENQRLTDFATGQNRILADAQIAQFNQQQENLRAGQRDLGRVADRQLEADRLNLQRRQIDNQFEANREQRALEYARMDNDRERYNADARRAEANRDRDIAVADRQLTDVRERVARDDAFRHAQLQETQKLALEQLAAQQRDNERRHQLEQNRIDNQRQVDADRAVSDRELIGNLSSRITQLERQQTPQDLPSGRGLVEEFDTSTSLTGGGAVLEREDSSLRAQPEPESSLSLQPVQSTPATQRTTSTRQELTSPTPERDPETGIADPSGAAQRERELRSRAAEGLEPSKNLRSQRRPDGTLRGTPLAIVTPPAETSPRPKLKPGEVIKAPVQGTLAQRQTTPQARPVKKQEPLFESPAGQAFAKEVDLSLKALEPRGGITDSAIERDLQAIASQVKTTLYDTGGEGA